jgi:hypothetical protein
VYNLRMFRVLPTIVVFCLASAVFSADRPVGISKRAVDMVSQKKGPMLLGAILGRQPDQSLQIAVCREWLKHAEPELYAREMADETATRTKRLETLLQRLKTWMAARADDKGLMFALQPERRRIEKLLTQQTPRASEQPQFFVLQIESRNIRKALRQAVGQRRIAAFAWRERLADGETRSAEDLATELRDRNIRLETETPNLGDRLPPTDQSADEWANRQAMFEYKFRQPLDFQGTAGLLLKTGDENARVDAGSLLTELLQNQLGSQLADLLEPNSNRSRKTSDAGLERAKAAAQSAGIRGFRVTTMDHDLSQQMVTVTTTFYAQLANDKWKRVHSISEAIDASKPRGDSQQQIKDDPRIKQILTVVKQFGLPQSSLDTALQFGAATREAQQNVDGQFLEFLDRYIRRVDSPPLPSGR